MSTRLLKPTRPQRLDIDCNVGDAIVANLAVHIVFFFEKSLDTAALSRAFVEALDRFPIFAGRMARAAAPMRIRCEGQGVPFTCVSSERTLREAIRSASEDDGGWLVDPVHGVAARWARGPLCKVRVTALAGGATAIGFSWHHAIGDMQTLMLFMNAWAAAAEGRSLPEPLIVEDRAAYLDRHLPPDNAVAPSVRYLAVAEAARFASYLAKDARRQRNLRLYFGEDEIARMRADYGSGSPIRLSANDVVCAHVCEALMTADPAVAHRTLAIVVNARTRCGLDPLLIGNIVTTVNLDLRAGERARSIAGRIRHAVNHFADEHRDLRMNQKVLDGAGLWHASRCVTSAFNPARWNPLVTNWSGFDLYGICFEGAFPTYYTPVRQVPIAGGCIATEGFDGSGVLLHIMLPPKDFEAMSTSPIREGMHRFRQAGDDIPRLHSAAHG
ncbi:hypothetical protein DVS77_08955 [Mycolicibacterium moriokaense]|nr:hypothetical protein DVS77_08955 [Mycolicibacterium moriokaense]